MPALLTRARCGGRWLHAHRIFNTLSFPGMALAALLLLSLAFAGVARADTVTSASAGDLDLEALAKLEFPWGIAMLPDDRLLITEKPGRLRIFDQGELSEPVRGVPEVDYRGAGDQGGLLDVVLHPDFADNQMIYLSYSEAADTQPANLRDTGDVRFGGHLNKSAATIRGGAVARGRLDGNRLTDVEVIWRQYPKTIGRGHFGHRLMFGPDDKLFITSGDRMRFEPARDLGTNLGKVLRINDDGSVPENNPFAGQEDARGDIWSYGHRNILATVRHPESGHLFAFEMGPLGGDEVNIVEKGKDYGWPAVSNGSQYNRDTILPHAGTDEYQQPIRTWTPVISPSGAVVYDGDLMPGWQGSVLVGGLSSTAIVRLEMDDDRIAVEERIDMKRRIRDLLQAPDGSLYVLVDDKDGSLLQLTPAD